MATRFEIILNWLRAWWYHRRSQLAHIVMPAQSPSRRQLPPPHLAQTVADRLDWLCQRYKGDYKILRLGDGVIVLFLQGHEVISSGTWSNTAMCVTALEKRLNANS